MIAEVGSTTEMTVLPDHEIAHAVHYGDLDIDPYDESNLQPASYDITLGDEWEVPVQASPGNLPITLEEGIPDSARCVYQSDEFVLNSIQNPEAPGSEADSGPFVLGYIEETISVPDNMTAEVRGRSSIGRLGIVPHTAGWGDPGFSGQLTLELYNLSPNPVQLESGTRIAQVIFKRMNSSASTPYGAKNDQKYQGQTGVTESRIEEDTKTLK